MTREHWSDDRERPSQYDLTEQLAALQAERDRILAYAALLQWRRTEERFAHSGCDADKAVLNVLEAARSDPDDWALEHWMLVKHHKCAVAVAARNLREKEGS